MEKRESEGYKGEREGERKERLRRESENGREKER